ncbi:hypothetical protein JCGZ_14469 [Jatropha curcas]|uniref:DUF4378 domain-containing protein n=1 Tax=Jatropha curcas TaxID=180498 RepID=A0A067K104_JATCU|nr:hypothetical protein JCGZ_14469 [Jatropha curcas]
MFAFHSVINALKNFQFTSVKAPSIFPRSISRRLSKKSSASSRDTERASESKLESEVKITVTIKDIIRWKSFRDLMEEKSPPLDLASSPHHCTTTSTASATTTPCSSNGSSWCDSDFTSEYLPFWNGNSEEYGENEAMEVGKKDLPCVGEATIEAEKIVGPKAEEKQLSSPISVIDIEFEGDEDSSSIYDESNANVESKYPFNLEKWMAVNENTSSEEETETNTINGEEEEAWQLLNYFKQTSSMKEERLVFDFFREELCRKTYETKNEGFECEMLISRVKEWINGEDRMWVGGENKEACIREMERQGKWSKLEEEEEMVGLEVENWMMGLLLEDLLLDLVC